MVKTVNKNVCLMSFRVIFVESTKGARVLVEPLGKPEYCINFHTPHNIKHFQYLWSIHIDMSHHVIYTIYLVHLLQRHTSQTICNTYLSGWYIVEAIYIKHVHGRYIVLTIYTTQSASDNSDCSTVQSVLGWTAHRTAIQHCWSPGDRQYNDIGKHGSTQLVQGDDRCVIQI